MIDLTNIDDDEVRNLAIDTKETYTEWDTMTAQAFLRDCFFINKYGCTPIIRIHYLYQVWAKEQCMPVTTW